MRKHAREMREMRTYIFFNGLQAALLKRGNAGNAYFDALLAQLKRGNAAVNALKTKGFALPALPAKVSALLFRTV